MNFCSNCGSDRLTIEVPEGDTFERIVCANCQFIHYQNPKIIVGCVVIEDDKVLLCRRGIEPRYGMWNLPGGFMENGETVEEGARRETLEETNAHVEIVRLHSVYNLPHVNQVYLHFLARFQKLHYSTTPESTEVALFSESEIPWDNIAFSSTTFSLQKFFENRNHTTFQVHMGVFHKKM